ncbi:MAG: arginine deiminase family protein, partial [bacterium]|nr:arginine deiminase family protein [bacterium]
MCSPDFFDIEYEINPWMDVDNQVDPSLAKKQWEKLYKVYTEQLGWDVQLIDPIKHLPDMVFTANGGLVVDGKVVLPTFRAPDRQAETAYFEKWFKANGYKEFHTPKYDFEGEGDALVWNDTIFMGYPWRSDKAAAMEVSKFLGKKLIPLQLTNASFYHLDTALTIIDKETVAIYPPNFTDESVKTLKETVPNVIEASKADAYAYGLNAMSDGHNIVISEHATGLISQYKKRGMIVYPVSISEFQKSGGGVKCL